jgi:D-glycero-D-manno-heptose 1,7-bisphosphate phosphatase
MLEPGVSDVEAERAAFLDRDGVLIKAMVHDGRPHPPGSTDELEVLPGVVEACAALRTAGLRLVCVTNQPDIARGLTSASTVNEQNHVLESVLGLDAVLVCPHDDGDDCPCRKPRPGLLLEGAARFDLDLRSSVMVGDRWRDVEAGRNAGCHTVFIEQHYAERRPVAPDLTVGSLLEATPWILEAAGRHEPGVQEQP